MSFNTLHTIDPADVRNVLDTLLYAKGVASTRSPLHSLTLVEEIVQTRPFPISSLDRQMVLYEILTDTISVCYHHHRQVHHLPSPSITADLTETHYLVAQDVQTENPELMAWSWMYHRYVRVDLNLGPDVFAAMMGIVSRTLRRYTVHGIKRLTEELMHKERTARYARNRLRMEANLPGPSTFVGRDGLLTDMLHACYKEFPFHFQITGEAGVGKTAMVGAYVRQLIMLGHVDNLIWETEPSTLTSVYDMLHHWLQPPSTISLGEYLMTNTIVIVLDGCEGLPSDKLNSLLHICQWAVVFIVRQQYDADLNARIHVHVPPLAEADAMHYIRYVARTRIHQSIFELTEHEIESIYRQVGGHPAAIQAQVAAHFIEQAV